MKPYPCLNLHLVLSFFMIASLTVSVPAFMSGQGKPNLKSVPTPYTSPASGVEMYKAYCAVCHGLTGKGDGPAAPALKARPTDLTTMAQRNKGQFPTLQVRSIIEGRASVVAHGTSEMPIWGPVFRWLGGSPHDDEAKVTMRVTNLTKYIESIQIK